MLNNATRRVPKQLAVGLIAVLVLSTAVAVLIHLHMRKPVAVTTLPISTQTATSPITPLVANNFVHAFYTAFLTSNNPTSVIQQYGTVGLLAAFTNDYLHNSASVSAQDYANGSIVCGSIKPISIASVGTLTSGTTNAQVQVVEVENKESSTANHTATLITDVIHQGSDLKIGSIQCQALVGGDNH